MPNAMPPVYTCGYSDQLEDIGDDGCFPVPDGPGLGVTYDWDRIERTRTAAPRLHLTWQPMPIIGPLPPPLGPRAR